MMESLCLKYEKFKVNFREKYLTDISKCNSLKYDDIVMTLTIFGVINVVDDSVENKSFSENTINFIKDLIDSEKTPKSEDLLSVLKLAVKIFSHFQENKGGI